MAGSFSPIYADNFRTIPVILRSRPISCSWAQRPAKHQSESVHIFRVIWFIKSRQNCDVTSRTRSKRLMPRCDDKMHFTPLLMRVMRKRKPSEHRALRRRRLPSFIKIQADSRHGIHEKKTGRFVFCTTSLGQQKKVTSWPTNFCFPAGANRIKTYAKAKETMADMKIVFKSVLPKNRCASHDSSRNATHTADEFSF